MFETKLPTIQPRTTQRKVSLIVCITRYTNATIGRSITAMLKRPTMKRLVKQTTGTGTSRTAPAMQIQGVPTIAIKRELVSWRPTVVGTASADVLLVGADRKETD